MKTINTLSHESNKCSIKHKTTPDNTNIFKIISLSPYLAQLAIFVNRFFLCMFLLQAYQLPHEGLVYLAK